MKWVAIMLLLMNGAYFAFQLNNPPPPPAQVERFPYKGKGLVLLAEQEKLEQAKAFAEENRQKRIAALQTKREQKPVQPAPKAEVVAVAPKPAPVPETKPAPKPAAVPESAPVTVAPLQPKSEPAPKPAPKPQPIPEPVSKPAPTSLAKACYTIGPFLLVSDVANAAQVFESASIYARQRAAAERKQVGYWVYIPPRQSAQAARAALKTLNDNALTEVLMISEGTKANAVSAGVYQSDAEAEQRRAAIAALGLPVKLEPLYRTQPQYWLDVELMQVTQVPAKVWQEVSRAYPNTKQQRHKCD